METTFVNVPLITLTIITSTSIAISVSIIILHCFDAVTASVNRSQRSFSLHLPSLFLFFSLENKMAGLRYVNFHDFINFVFRNDRRYYISETSMYLSDSILHQSLTDLKQSIYWTVNSRNAWWWYWQVTTKLSDLT